MDTSIHRLTLGLAATACIMAWSAPSEAQRQCPTEADRQYIALVCATPGALCDRIRAAKRRQCLAGVGRSLIQRRPITNPCGAGGSCGNPVGREAYINVRPVEDYGIPPIEDYGLAPAEDYDLGVVEDYILRPIGDINVADQLGLDSGAPQSMRTQTTGR